MNRFCARKKSTTIGTIITVETAITRCHGDPWARPLVPTTAENATASQPSAAAAAGADLVAGAAHAPRDVRGPAHPAQRDPDRGADQPATRRAPRSRTGQSSAR